MNEVLKGKSTQPVDKLTLFGWFLRFLPGTSFIITIADIQKAKFIRNIKRFYVIVRYNRSHLPVMSVRSQMIGNGAGKL